VKDAKRQKCHTDSILPCPSQRRLTEHLPVFWNCEHVAPGMCNPSLSVGQELCNAVLSGNWSIPSAQKVQLTSTELVKMQRNGQPLSLLVGVYMAFPSGLAVKNLPCNAGGPGSIPGSGRQHDNPLQYSCLENPMDRGAWQVTVHRVAQSWT